MRLLVISNMHPGPRKPHFGVFVADRAAAYRDLGAGVRVVASRDPRRGPLRTPAKYVSLLARSLWAALRFRPDVIEGHYLAPTAVIAALAARLAGCPYVLYVHGSDLDTRYPGIGRAVSRAAELHTNSEDTAGRIASVYPAAPPVQVIPPGIDLERFRPFGVPADPPLVLFVGDRVHHKGADVFLRALSLLEGEWMARVVGSGPEERPLRQLAAGLGVGGRVDWTGTMDHLALGPTYSEASVVAVPSRRDALGQVALEALACGVPVVVSGVGGLASIPEPACGEVVPPDDPAALAAALARWVAARNDPTVREAAVRRAEGFDLRLTSQRAYERLASIAGRLRGSSGP